MRVGTCFGMSLKPIARFHHIGKTDVRLFKQYVRPKKNISGTKKFDPKKNINDVIYNYIKLYKMMTQKWPLVEFQEVPNS